MKTKVLAASTKVGVDVFSESYIKDGWKIVDAPWFETCSQTGKETWYQRISMEE